MGVVKGTSLPNLGMMAETHLYLSTFSANQPRNLRAFGGCMEQSTLLWAQVGVSPVVQMESNSHADSMMVAQ